MIVDKISVRELFGKLEHIIKDHCSAVTLQIEDFSLVSIVFCISLFFMLSSLVCYRLAETNNSLKLTCKNKLANER